MAAILAAILFLIILLQVAKHFLSVVQHFLSVVQHLSMLFKCLLLNQKKVTQIIVLSHAPLSKLLRPTLLEGINAKVVGVSSCQKWLVLVGLYGADWRNRYAKS